MSVRQSSYHLVVILAFGLFLLPACLLANQSSAFNGSNSSTISSTTAAAPVQPNQHLQSQSIVNINETLVAKGSLEDSIYVPIPIAAPADVGLSKASSSSSSTIQQQQSSLDDDAAATEDDDDGDDTLNNSLNNGDDNGGTKSVSQAAQTVGGERWTGSWPKKFQIGYIKQSDLHQVLVESLKADSFGSLKAGSSPQQSQSSSQVTGTATTSTSGSGVAPAVALTTSGQQQHYAMPNTREPVSTLSGQTKNLRDNNLAPDQPLPPSLVNGNNVLAQMHHLTRANSNNNNLAQGSIYQPTLAFNSPPALASRFPINLNTNQHIYLSKLMSSPMAPHTHSPQLQPFVRQQSSFNTNYQQQNANNNNFAGNYQTFFDAAHNQMNINNLKANNQLPAHHLPPRIFDNQNSNNQYRATRHNGPPASGNFAALFKNQPIYTFNNYQQQEQSDLNSLNMVMGGQTPQQQQRQQQRPQPIVAAQAGYNWPQTSSMLLSSSKTLKPPTVKLSPWRPVEAADKDADHQQQQVSGDSGEKTTISLQDQQDSIGNISSGDDSDEGFSSSKGGTAPQSIGLTNVHPMINNFYANVSSKSQSPANKIKATGSFGTATKSGASGAVGTKMLSPAAKRLNGSSSAAGTKTLSASTTTPATVDGRKTISTPTTTASSSSTMLSNDAQTTTFAPATTATVSSSVTEMPDSDTETIESVDGAEPEPRITTVATPQATDGASTSSPLTTTTTSSSSASSTTTTAADADSNAETTTTAIPTTTAAANENSEVVTESSGGGFTTASPSSAEQTTTTTQTPSDDSSDEPSSTSSALATERRKSEREVERIVEKQQANRKKARSSGRLINSNGATKGGQQANNNNKKQTTIGGANLPPVANVKVTNAKAKKSAKIVVVASKPQKRKSKGSQARSLTTIRNSNKSNKSNKLIQSAQIFNMSPAQAQSTAQTLASLLLARCMSSANCAHLLDICTTKQASVSLPDSASSSTTTSAPTPETLNSIDGSSTTSTTTSSSSTNTTTPTAPTSAAINANWSMPVGLASGSIMSLTQALGADKVLKMFAQWKDAVDNTLDFNTNFGYTLILPSNDAISRLPQATIDNWLQNGELLEQIIQSHILDSVVTIDLHQQSADTGKQQQQSSKVLRAKGLHINQHRDRMFTINGKRVVYANQIAPSGGRIHVIDGVFESPFRLQPSTKPLDIMDTLKQCDKFDGFVTLAEGTGLNQILKQDGPMTVFVPSNEALMKIPDNELDVIKSNSTALKEFLLYHVVNGSYFSQDLRDGQQLSSMLNRKPIQVGIRVDGCSRRLVEANTSPMRRADIATKNGVIHILDWYLSVRDEEWCEPIASRLAPQDSTTAISGATTSARLTQQQQQQTSSDSSSALAQQQQQTKLLQSATGNTNFSDDIMRRSDVSVPEVAIA